jgi:hypothetical protein
MALPAAALWNMAEDATPSVAAFSKNSLTTDVISFSSDDFVADAGKLTLDSIILTSLPDQNAGVLTLGDKEIALGDAIGMSAVSGLRFRPLENPSVAATCFTFTPIFSDGTTGQDVKVGLYLLNSENSAPVAENLSISTYKNVAVTGQFTATDPEGDLLTFRLMDKPARGEVSLPEDGSANFVYTPYENKMGKDSFTYIVEDAVGNQSKPATVDVKIKKPDTKVTYADMDGVPAHKAAIRLAEEGILIGECMGGNYYFQPSLPVSRSEFVALAMQTVKLNALDGISRTGFADDASIPTWSKGYVASALKSGVVQGNRSDDGIIFRADSTITRAEAAVLLDRLLQVTDVTSPTLFTDSDLAPAWAYQSAVNLETVGVLNADANGALDLSDTLTRADAAEMLSGALDVLDSRESNSWLPWK